MREPRIWNSVLNVVVVLNLKNPRAGKEASLVLACPKCGYKKPEVGDSS